ncbi:hypothetical protein BS50DRAFT_572294 [Corynespora cassiicola Philippines]|uniref:Heterokaryon incompatibility domain-containing protein n=1 Tax=Corynespora cassiicola Philippines TaxID=1448308 RepID=A0A2T2NV15_CORCC|nr:hypothetical protein BS50DRAFT_572294 [Corynespora cassiicola Philippines]
MRLINTSTLKLEWFVNDIPDYVIISHTWGEEEITFDDFDKTHAKNMAGYVKIDFCCKQACSDDFEYAWVDTCCTIQTHHRRLRPMKGWHMPPKMAAECI